ncbi:hypothetical protein SCRM01_026 [Synechococcus phage S-CRM01]|uniref:hypothetical protein n=1 Tax=Synechococcus phage S-CRM01 TaxID=1026955 RepID=UPI000209E344|nr:hypothetical protein SCRM01_026 [Synechococcus phage S-CRM01]AEC52973.1 hypothetical protein SCRM01_026 [Synechococcus phage S-CRM01]
MAFDFPASPITNQVYSEGSRSWQFDGTSWVSQSSPGPQGPQGVPGVDGANSEYLWIGANDFRPTITNGCTTGNDETPANDINRNYLIFNPTTERYAQTWIGWPTGWNTFRARFVWKADPTGFSAAAAVWRIACRIYTDLNDLDSIQGVAQGVTDTALNVDWQFITNLTPAITPGGTRTTGYPTNIIVYREVGNSFDLLPSDAHLIGVILYKDT